MRRLKLKLAFNKETEIEQRKSKLLLWLSVLFRGENAKIVEEEHFDTMSYIVALNSDSDC
ncbi:MAG: hypothetical protein J6T70_01835 [Bacteroidales bacterium]|nr:hypothetical protein [Bacteroidales bacterium]MBQ3617092.1 hypothetical protein [Bacteroidales bacterium]MDD6001880.1 hypothetical protein [Bacteroidales bacterium]